VKSEYELVKRATFLIEKAKKINPILTGHTRKGLMAGAMYVVAIVSGIKRTQYQTSKLYNVSEPTVRSNSSIILRSFGLKYGDEGIPLTWEELKNIAEEMSRK